jgi:transposase
MKQETLQMLKGIDKNLEKIQALVKCLAKEIENKVGRQTRGRSRMNLQLAVAGILYYTKFRCGWAHIPPCFGNGKTIYGWFRIMVAHEITWSAWQELVRMLERKKKLQLANLSIDGSLVQMTNGGKLAICNPRNHGKKSLNRAILIDGKGVVISTDIAHGTQHDSKFGKPLIRKAKKTITLKNNFWLHGDKAFDSFDLRLFVARLGGYAFIPPRNHGFMIPYHPVKDSRRWKVERSHSWVNRFLAAKLVSLRLTECIKQLFYLVYTVICSRFLPLRDLVKCFGRADYAF